MSALPALCCPLLSEVPSTSGAPDGRRTGAGAGIDPNICLEAGALLVRLVAAPRGTGGARVFLTATPAGAPLAFIPLSSLTLVEVLGLVLVLDATSAMPSFPGVRERGAGGASIPPITQSVLDAKEARRVVVLAVVGT